jgi:hypothetical protein
MRRQPFIRIRHISHLEIRREIPKPAVVGVPDSPDSSNDLFRLFWSRRDGGDEAEPKIVLTPAIDEVNLNDSRESSIS